MKERSIFLFTKFMQPRYDYFDHMTKIELRLSAQNEGPCSGEFSLIHFEILHTETMFCYVLAFAWSLVAFFPPTLQWSCAS